MLNSLYGRFGMTPYLNKHDILNSNEVLKLSEDYEITDLMSFQEDKELVSYLDNNNEEPDTLSSIPIAAAILRRPQVLEFI